MHYLPLFLSFVNNLYNRDACAYCKEEVVNKYVEEDLNVINMATVHGESCLFLTAVKNCYSIAEKLIELGSDVNARIEHPDVSFYPLASVLFSTVFPIIFFHEPSESSFIELPLQSTGSQEYTIDLAHI